MGHYIVMLTLPVLHRSQDRNHFPISIFIAPTHKATDHSGVLWISFSRKLTAVLEESNSACLFPHKFIIRCSLSFCHYHLFSTFLLNAWTLQVTSFKNQKIVHISAHFYLKSFVYSLFNCWAFFRTHLS